MSCYFILLCNSLASQLFKTISHVHTLNIYVYKICTRQMRWISVWEYQILNISTNSILICNPFSMMCLNLTQSVQKIQQTMQQTQRFLWAQLSFSSNVFHIMNRSSNFHRERVTNIKRTELNETTLLIFWSD